MPSKKVRAAKAKEAKGKSKPKTKAQEKKEKKAQEAAKLAKMKEVAPYPLSSFIISRLSLFSSQCSL
jgi:hypothetical protein